MKSLKISFFTLLALVAVLATSCEKEDSTANLSKITYYPNFTFNGAATMLIACGGAYAEPGVTATENGASLTVTTTVASTYFAGSNLATVTPDRYGITYSAVNVDGYSGEEHRTVWAACNGDLVNSIEGLYKSTVVRNGVVSAQYANLKYVIIKKGEGNMYYISDAIGGYYDFGRNYGDGYASKGMTITANNIPGNDFSYGAAVPVGAFGGACAMSDMVVNAGTKTITFTSTWSAGYTFAVTLNQVIL